MARRIWTAALAAVLSVAASVGPAGAETFRIDPSRSTLVVEVFKDGLAARFAHDHVVSAVEFSGRVTYDPAAPDASSVSLEVRTGSLRADDAAVRRRFGLAGGPSARDLADIEKAMKGEGQLDVDRFPVMRFASTRITRQSDGQYRVAGLLTIRGIAAEVNFPAAIEPEAGGLRGHATLRFTQSAFGYAPYSALLGAIKNKDEVTLRVDLLAFPE